MNGPLVVCRFLLVFFGIETIRHFPAANLHLAGGLML